MNSFFAIQVVIEKGTTPATQWGHEEKKKTVLFLSFFPFLLHCPLSLLVEVTAAIMVKKSQ